MRCSYLGKVSTLTNPPSINGLCDSSFALVREAFITNFVEHNEIGASVCIEIDGRVVVNLWGGFSDVARTQPWQSQQLVNAFSVGKGVTALVAAQCVDRGELSYDTRIAEVWPSFAQHGKEEMTLRDALGHRVGLPAVRKRLDQHAMYNWNQMCSALADETPWWTPGSTHGYHVNTFGFIVGEVLRRVTGKSVGALISERIATPLSADIYLGCPSPLHSRMAEFEWPGDGPPLTAPENATDEQLMQFNTYYNPPGLSGSKTVNTADWRQAEIPSTNMHASAPGVARMYSALAHGGSLGSHHLITQDTLHLAVQEVSTGADIVLGRDSRFGHGFQIPLPERGFGPNAEAFGHYGAGGSVGFCDPVARVGFGYVMNQMGPRWQNPRNRALMNALYECL
jgi:CubicO group peptidase (beta-lactamase class C family)